MSPFSAVTLRRALSTALHAQARGGPHAQYWRDVVLFVLMAEALASAAHDGPPHAPARPRRRSVAHRQARRLARSTVTGRRPRG